MNPQELLEPNIWAQRTFGKVNLHDMRRTRRAVQIAAYLATNPMGSLPAQMSTWSQTKSLYRLLNEPDVTCAALMQPHREHTKEAASQIPVVLLVQDTTEIALSHRQIRSGIGPVGKEHGQGFLIQTVLAVHPQTRDVLGCIAQEPFLRVPVPKGEQRYQRRQREQRESNVWPRQVQQIGIPPPGITWVHVGDRGADMFAVFRACQATQTQFLVRAAQDRRIQEAGDEGQQYALTLARSWSSQESRPFEVPATHGHQGRSTHLHLSFGPMTLMPPRTEPRMGTEPVAVWVVRVWEEHAPEGEEPLEWLLLTSVPTTTPEQAWERVDWYRHRWVVEDYHQCLKTGCRLEERQLQTGEGMMRLLGILSPIAVRLLQLRALARETPERPAQEVLDPLMVAVLAAHRNRPLTTPITMGIFWKEVAGMGGYLARASDGPPGWRTLWKGWLLLQTMLEGARLAMHLWGENASA